MKQELMRAKEFSEIFEILESFPKKLVDSKILLQTADMPKLKVKNRYIHLLRKSKRINVEAD